MESFLIRLFAAFWKAFFDAALEHLPQIYAAWNKLTTSTITDADNPADLQSQLRKREADAQK